MRGFSESDQHLLDWIKEQYEDTVVALHMILMLPRGRLQCMSNKQYEWVFLYFLVENMRQKCAGVYLKCSLKYHRAFFWEDESSIARFLSKNEAIFLKVHKKKSLK